jgi:hypothetical protein
MFWMYRIAHANMSVPSRKPSQLSQIRPSAWIWTSTPAFVKSDRNKVFAEIAGELRLLLASHLLAGRLARGLLASL